jgi:hypothetical protein
MAAEKPAAVVVRIGVAIAVWVVVRLAIWIIIRLVIWIMIRIISEWITVAVKAKIYLSVRLWGTNKHHYTS